MKKYITKQIILAIFLVAAILGFSFASFAQTTPTLKQVTGAGNVSIKPMYYSGNTHSLISNFWVMDKKYADSTYAAITGGAYLSSTLNAGKIYIGNGSNVGTAVTPSLSATPGTFSLATTGVFTFPDATTSLRGLLNSTDWNIFNNKEPAQSGTGYVYKSGSTTSYTNSIPNSSLANSTISGISLGSNLNTHTVGYGLSGSSYNGSSAISDWKVDSTKLASKLFTAANYAPISYTASVPSARTITINGTTQDLSANRTWSVGDALVANPLSQFASTTSAQLAGVISDETGTGKLVFGSSPTFTTPTLGVATATSLSITSGSSSNLFSGSGTQITIGSGLTLSSGTLSSSGGGTSTLTATQIGYGSGVNALTSDSMFKWNSTSQYLQLYNKNNNSATEVVRAPFTVSTFTDIPINGYFNNDILFSTIANSTEGGFEMWGIAKSTSTIGYSICGLISQTTAVNNYPAIAIRGGKRNSLNQRQYLDGSDRLCGWTNDVTGDFRFIATMMGNGSLKLGDSIAPAARIEVLDNSAPQLRITHTNSSHYTDFQTDINGYQYVMPSGQSFSVGSYTADVWSLGASNAFFNFASQTSNNNARLQVVATGTATAGLQFGNTSIRRAGISVVDGSDMAFFTNTTNSGTGLTQACRLLSSGRMVFGTATTANYKVEISSGDIALAGAGNSLHMKTGVSNCAAGTGTLVAGTLVINTNIVTANSLIFITDIGGTVTNLGSLYISARSAGTSFTVSSSNALDVSNFNWFIVEPY